MKSINYKLLKVYDSQYGDELVRFSKELQSSIDNCDNYYTVECNGKEYRGNLFGDKKLVFLCYQILWLYCVDDGKLYACTYQTTTHKYGDELKENIDYRYPSEIMVDTMIIVR